MALALFLRVGVAVILDRVQERVVLRREMRALCCLIYDFDLIFYLGEMVKQLRINKIGNPMV